VKYSIRRRNRNFRIENIHLI